MTEMRSSRAGDPRHCQQLQAGESAGQTRQGVDEHGHGSQNQPAGGGRGESCGVATSATLLQPPGQCQADPGDTARQGSDPVVPDNAQFPAVSASDNPIIPSLFFSKSL